MRSGEIDYEPTQREQREDSDLSSHGFEVVAHDGWLADTPVMHAQQPPSARTVFVAPMPEAIDANDDDERMILPFVFLNKLTP